MAYRQINVRLPADDVRYIEAAATLDEQSIAEFLKPLFAQVVERAKSDKDVREFLLLKEKRAAVKQGKLTDLDERRSTRGSA